MTSQSQASAANEQSSSTTAKHHRPASADTATYVTKWPEDSPPAQQALFEALKAVRDRIARERGYNPQVVLTDATIRAISRQMPHNTDELRRIKGVGPKKARSYSPALLEVVRRYSR